MVKNIKKSGVLSLLIAVFAYWIARTIKNSPAMPKIGSIIEAIPQVFLHDNFYSNFFYTLKIVSISILIAFVVGISVSIFISMFSIAEELIMPILNALRNIPAIALFPLFIVLFGIGDLSRINVILWIAIPPMIITSVFALNNVDKELVESAKNCGANKVQLYFYIKFPLAFIEILNGLKIVASQCFISVIAADMLGATKGLGYMILWDANTFRYAEMYIYILVVSLTGFLVNVAIEKLISFMQRRIYYGKEDLKSSNSVSHSNVHDAVNCNCEGR